MSDGSRKWVSGRFDGRDYPLRGRDYWGRTVTVMGPAYPDGPGGVDPNQLYVVADSGDVFLTVASLIWIPIGPGSETYARLRAPFRRVGPRKPSFIDHFLANQAALSKAGYFDAVDHFHETREKLLAIQETEPSPEDWRVAWTAHRDACLRLDEMAARLFP
jgi:hypothetical protein